MRSCPLLLIFSLCACGRIGFDAQPGDAGTTDLDAAGIDAATADAAPMFATGPFGDPVFISELSTDLGEDDPTLTADMLEIYFKSNRGTGTGDDIFVATRTSVDVPWDAPILVAELSTASVDNTPEVSFDGLRMLLSSDRDGDVDIFESTRASRSDAWSVPVVVAELSSADDDYAAARDGSGRHLIMTRIVAGDLELFTADRPSISARWNAPQLASELSTPDYQADAVLDERGLLLFYTAVAPGGGNDRDLFVAERATVTSEFGAGVPLVELNSTDIDEDPWISPDLTTLFFVREAAGGSKDLYMATRPLAP